MLLYETELKTAGQTRQKKFHILISTVGFLRNDDIWRNTRRVSIFWGCLEQGNTENNYCDFKIIYEKTKVEEFSLMEALAGVIKITKG